MKRLGLKTRPKWADNGTMADSWSLYNSKTKEAHTQVTVEDLRNLLQSLQRDEQRFWFAWNSTRDTWEPALDVLFEMTRPNLNAKNHEPINLKNIVEMEYEADETPQVQVVDLSEPENQVISIVRAKPKIPEALNAEAIALSPEASSTPKSGFDRRRYPRYHARFRVIIKNENLTFRTFSMDVSLGGLALETAVPPGCVGSLCQILIGNSSSGENISFSAKMLNSRVESKYFSFVKSPQESLTKLQQWLAACEPLKRSS